MAPVTFSIPGKPMGWKRARLNGGTHFTPADMRERQAYVRLMATQEMRGAAPMDGPVRLSLGFYFEIPKSWSKKKQAAAFGTPHTSKPDASNLQKLIEDALNGTVFRDDCQIAEAVVVKRYGAQALTVVTVEAIAP